MSDFYFIRHGQAGTRLEYDTLSELGHQQALLLGAYLAGQNVSFSRIIIGALNRHQQTAASVLTAYQVDGDKYPEPVTDPEWNEFDLDAVYQSIAPQLAKDDAIFAAQYQALQQQVAEHGATSDSTINRSWNPCDTAVIHAWVTARYPVTCETWAAFRGRICGALAKLVASNPDGDVAIFTSATPTAISLAQAMDLSDRKMFQLAGVMINSAISVIRMKDGEIRMFSFNSVPHLDDSAMRTHR